MGGGQKKHRIARVHRGSEDGVLMNAADDLERSSVSAMRAAGDVENLAAGEYHRERLDPATCRAVLERGGSRRVGRHHTADRGSHEGRCGWIRERALPRSLLVASILLTCLSFIFFSDMFTPLSTILQIGIQAAVQRRCFVWGAEGVAGMVPQ